MATEGVAKGGQRGRRGHFLQCTPSDSDGAQPGWPANPAALPLPQWWWRRREGQSSAASLRASNTKTINLHGNS
jgi:hypothetical protein